MPFVLKEKERLDDLVKDGMGIIQRPDEFCFSLDSVLLAHFVTIRPRDRFVDLGTGTAVIPLLLSARGASSVAAIEKNPITADMARRSVAGNGKDHVISVVEGDYTDPAALFPSGAFTSAVVNPPYREAGTGAVSPKAGVAAACHELTASLEDVFRAARYLLAYGGRLTMVHRADRLADLFVTGRKYGMEPKRLRMVQSHAGEKASRLLCEWKYGGRPGLSVLAPLVVHEANGAYTEEVLGIYGKH